MGMVALSAQEKDSIVSLQWAKLMAFGGAPVDISVVNLIAHLVPHHSTNYNKAKDMATNGSQFLFCTLMTLGNKDSQLWC